MGLGRRRGGIGVGAGHGGAQNKRDSIYNSFNLIKSARSARFCEKLAREWQKKMSDGGFIDTPGGADRLADNDASWALEWVEEGIWWSISTYSPSPLEDRSERLPHKLGERTTVGVVMVSWWGLRGLIKQPSRLSNFADESRAAPSSKRQPLAN